MLAACLLVLAMQEPSPPPVPPPTSRSEKKPPESPRSESSGAAPTKGLRKSVKGTFGGIDLEQKTVRFIDENGRSQVWPVDLKLAEAAPGRAEYLAKVFQPGEPIYVSYHEDDGKPTVAGLAKRTAADDELDRRREEEKR